MESMNLLKVNHYQLLESALMREDMVNMLFDAIQNLSDNTLHEANA
jgi:hypothetical protein